MRRRRRERLEKGIVQVVLMLSAATLFWCAGMASFGSCVLIVLGIRLAVPMP